MSQLKQFQEESRKKFQENHGQYTSLDSLKEAKDFLQQQTSLAYELGKKEVLDKITPRIGMLRQWLNEERITDKKMVTSEDIKDWLGLSALNEE